MELLNLINIYGEKFVPVFIRVAVMIAFIPFIGAQQTPVMIRAALALALTMMLLPVVNVDMTDPVRAVFEAFFIGAAIGLIIRIITGAIEMAAQWISIESGMTAAAVFNPLFSETLGPLSVFYSLASMVLFFLFDAHFYVIEGLVRSFDITSVHYKSIFGSVIKMNVFFFPLAFKIAAPILLVQTLTYIALGFLSRAMPQTNIFFVSFPLIITLSLIFIILALPASITVIAKGFMNVKDAIMVITR